MLHGLLDFLSLTGFADITWQMSVMWAVVAVLLYLAIVKGFEPLLLVPIAFGALVANLPTRGVMTSQMLPNGVYETATFKVEGVVLPSHGTEPGAATGHDERIAIKVDRIEGGGLDRYHRRCGRPDFDFRDQQTRASPARRNSGGGL